MAIRVSLLLKKLDTLSYEEFYKYWEGTHADLFLNVPIVKKTVLKFSQYHTDRAFSDGFIAQGLPVSEYDGQVDLWFATLEDFTELFQDEEYQRVVVPDGKIFSKVDESKLLIGHDKDFIIDGKRV